MQGLSDPSFFPTKKKPAPEGDEEGGIRPAFREAEIYSLIASFSGPETEYRRPLGMVEPGIRSMAQSDGR